MSTTTALAQYQALLNWITQTTSDLTSQFPTELTCHRGCTGCCQQHLSVFEVEAESLRQFLKTLPESVRQKLSHQARTTLEREAQFEAQNIVPDTEFPPDPARAIPCPALVDGDCAVYPARPVICRTHGFPLLYVDEETDEALLDVCPLNFTEAEDRLESLTETEVIPMTDINEHLVRANLAFLQNTTGGTANALNRRSIAEILLSVVSSQ